MSVVSDFLQTYFRYSVGQRAFEDICRQMVECRGDVEERQQLVDESCRLAIFVSDCSEELESISIRLINELQDEEERDDDFLNDVTLCINQAIEDRARANSYTNQVTYLRIGGTPRKPRRPRVANPFIPIIVDDVDERIPLDDDDGTKDTPIIEESLDTFPEGDEVQTDDVHHIEHDVPKDTVPDDICKTYENENPLAKESERILSESDDADGAGQ